MLQLLTSDAFMGVVGMVLAIVLPLVIRLVLKDKADAAEKMFEGAVSIGSAWLDKLSASTANTWDDKLAKALDAMRDYYAAHGQTLSAVDEQKAQVVFQAMHAPAPTPAAGA